MHFLPEKTRSMLQSKQNDQFDTPRLTHVVVVVNGFRCECFLSSFREKKEEVENEEKTIDGLQKRLKWM